MFQRFEKNKIFPIVENKDVSPSYKIENLLISWR